jgi:two-component system, response regulator PdtaR
MQKCVLVVEDQLLIALDLRQMLEKLGCSVLGPASSVEKALALLETHTPDAALLDEDLKGVPVTPVAEALRRRGIAYAIVSGHDRPFTGDEVLASARRLGKPPSVSAIRDVLSDLERQTGN